MNAHLTYMIAQQRSAELLRAAEKGRLARDAAVGPRSRWHPFPRFVAKLARLATRALQFAHEPQLEPNPRGAEQSADTGRLMLRFGSPADEDTLARLAALDSSKPPAYPVLLAEVDGQLLAALGLSDGTAVADPFHRTADLIDLLRARAHQLDGSGRIRRSVACPHGLECAPWRGASRSQAEDALPNPAFL
jgi:hypothetical protein